MADCIFCKIAAGEIPANIAYQDDNLVAFHDITPVAPTHVLIIPRQHFDNTAALKADQAALIGQMVLRAAQLARDLNIEASGYRLVTNTNKDGGQSVGHLHLHLLGGRAMTWPPG